MLALGSSVRASVAVSVGGRPPIKVPSEQLAAVVGLLKESPRLRGTIIAAVEDKTTLDLTQSQALLLVSEIRSPRYSGRLPKELLAALFDVEAHIFNR
jgi:hypothetical protein